MKKFLALLLAVVCTMSMVACGGTGKDTSAGAEKVVESFMDAFCDLDMDKVKDYVVDENDIPEEIANLDLSAGIKKIMEEMPSEAEAYASDFEKVFNDLIEKLKKSLSYKIKKTEKAEEDYIVTVELTVPDPEKMESIDMESLFAESLDETALNDMLMKMLAEGKISENSTEQEILDLIMPELIKIVKNVFDSIELETITKDVEIVVVQTEDGKWLVDAQKSNLDE